MISLHKKQNGFTIVELIIVLVVIGILSAIVITTFSGIQARSRNAKRQDDIKSLQTQLEAFYSQNGYYPSLANINSVSWRKTNMPNLNPSTMIDPSASDHNSTTAQLSATPGPKVFSYQVTDSNGNSCEKDNTNCAKYILTANYEGSVDGQKTYQKQNLD